MATSRRRWTQEDIKTTASMLADGKSRDEIAFTLGRTKQAVDAYITAHKWHFPDRPKRGIEDPRLQQAFRLIEMGIAIPWASKLVGLKAKYVQVMAISRCGGAGLMRKKAFTAIAENLAKQRENMR